MMTTAIRNFLLVDDHPLMRQAIIVTLRTGFAGARIEEAGDSIEALAYCGTLKFDLVLLDLRLGNEDGVQVARQLINLHKALKILMFSAETEPKVVRQALSAGVLGSVNKNNSGHLLLQAAERVMAGQKFLCPQAQRAWQDGLHAATAIDRAPSSLSPREHQVLEYLAGGESAKSAAFLMKISPKTVETHRQHIMQKLGLNSVSDLTRYAIRQGLIVA
jgi:two-component system NarL family response regulator